MNNRDSLSGPVRSVPRFVFFSFSPGGGGQPLEQSGSKAEWWHRSSSVNASVGRTGRLRWQMFNSQPPKPIAFTGIFCTYYQAFVEINTFFLEHVFCQYF